MQRARTAWNSLHADCSDRADSMHADVPLELHAKYFDTIYALLNDVSPAYRDCFRTAVSDKSSKPQPESGHASAAESIAAPQNGSISHGSDSQEPSE